MFFTIFINRFSIFLSIIIFCQQITHDYMLQQFYSLLTINCRLFTHPSAHTPDCLRLFVHSEHEQMPLETYVQLCQVRKLLWRFNGFIIKFPEKFVITVLVTA